MSRHNIWHSLIVWMSTTVMLALLWTVLSRDCEMPLDLSEKVVPIFFKPNAGVLSPESSSGRKGLAAVPLFNFLLHKTEISFGTSSHPKTGVDGITLQTLKTSAWHRRKNCLTGSSAVRQICSDYGRFRKARAESPSKWIQWILAQIFIEEIQSILLQHFYSQKPGKVVLPCTFWSFHSNPADHLSWASSSGESKRMWHGKGPWKLTEREQHDPDRADQPVPTTRTAQISL